MMVLDEKLNDQNRYCSLSRAKHECLNFMATHPVVIEEKPVDD